MTPLASARPFAPRRPLWLALPSVLLFVALGVAPATAAQTRDVSIRTISYDPSLTTLTSVGGTVRWTNVTSPSRVHDVVSSLPGYFHSPIGGSGSVYTHAFTAAGYFTYICSIHDTMLGAVDVPLLGAVIDDGGTTRFRLRVATVRLPLDSDYLYSLFRQDPGAAAPSFWTTTRQPIVLFTPVAPGEYRFTARLKYRPEKRHSADSQVLSLTYTPGG